MVTITDWLMDLSENYSVQHIDDLEGTVIKPINNEYFLVKHAEVHE